MDVSTLNLDHLGNVPSTYIHEWKVAEAVDTIVLPETVFKWYHVRSEGVTVPAEIDAEARAILVDAATNSAWTPEYGLNIAQLHVASRHVFLIAGVWRGHNELWERVYFKDRATNSAFKRNDMYDPIGEDVPTFCVWELGVICHERMAWHRYLFSRRTEADKRAWLADTYSGPV